MENQHKQENRRAVKSSDQYTRTKSTNRGPSTEEER